MARRRWVVLVLNIIATGLLTLEASQPCLAQASPAPQQLPMAAMAHDHGMSSDSNAGKPWCDDTVGLPTIIGLQVGFFSFGASPPSSPDSSGRVERGGAMYPP